MLAPPVAAALRSQQETGERVSARACGYVCVPEDVGFTEVKSYEPSMRKEPGRQRVLSCSNRRSIPPGYSWLPKSMVTIIARLVCFFVTCFCIILQRSHMEHAGVDARTAQFVLVGEAEHIALV